jgi:hypothetical protein
MSDDELLCNNADAGCKASFSSKRACANHERYCKYVRDKFGSPDAIQPTAPNSPLVPVSPRESARRGLSFTPNGSPSPSVTSTISPVPTPPTHGGLSSQEDGIPPNFDGETSSLNSSNGTHNSSTSSVLSTPRKLTVFTGVS